MAKGQCSTDSGITIRQAKAIAALITERNQLEAARTAGVGERTLYKWLADDNFRAALRDAEAALVDNAVRRLARGQEVALDTLETLMREAKNESTRVTAAVNWLNLFLRFSEARDIEARLAALERQAVK